jgi:hypothetical protein
MIVVKNRDWLGNILNTILRYLNNRKLKGGTNET